MCDAGATPYPGMGAREVMRRVRDGYRSAQLTYLYFTCILLLTYSNMRLIYNFLTTYF
jgi:hypothetical protein